ncbi:hypothetical protein [Streptosporangium lutulentum]|uniref:Uncharacterized protein n=1 Tax=Streptosporangium lutulentum TaxID=1461250 RepID=A0ABT9QAE7_9ACTN|nr:hypothetical protein [Streptosporangium lutulentum]MDP9843273.1 hypothetical protein [Streptosporangium lutulentum]
MTYDIEPYLIDVDGLEKHRPTPSWPIRIDWDIYYGCEKPDCERAVRKGVQYCCTPCAVAGEGKYEIEAHMASCDEKWAYRRPHVEANTW